MLTNNFLSLALKYDIKRFLLKYGPGSLYYWGTSIVILIFAWLIYGFFIVHSPRHPPDSEINLLLFFSVITLVALRVSGPVVSITQIIWFYSKENRDNAMSLFQRELADHDWYNHKREHDRRELGKLDALSIHEKKAWCESNKKGNWTDRFAEDEQIEVEQIFSDYVSERETLFKKEWAIHEPRKGFIKNYKKKLFNLQRFREHISAQEEAWENV